MINNATINMDIPSNTINIITIGINLLNVIIDNAISIIAHIIAINITIAIMVVVSIRNIIANITIIDITTIMDIAIAKTTQTTITVATNLNFITSNPIAAKITYIISHIIARIIISIFRIFAETANIPINTILTNIIMVNTITTRT